MPTAQLGERPPELRLVLWGFALNLIWEALQTPFYADRGGSLTYLAWSRLHCTGGDVLILLGCFTAVSLIWRNRSWMAIRGVLPRVLFVTLGLGYTAASEVLHTRWFQSWAYAPDMPVLFGVGLAPVLQWLLIPSALLFILAPSRALAPGLPRGSGLANGADSRLVAVPEEAIDPACGAPVPVERNNQFFDGERTIYFCSPECRRSYVARVRAER